MTDPATLSRLTPAQARNFVELLLSRMGFSFTGGRAVGRSFVLEGARGSGETLERIVAVTVFDEVSPPPLDGRHGIAFLFRFSDTFGDEWESVTLSDMARMGDSLGVEPSVPKPRQTKVDVGAFLPSVAKLEKDMSWGLDFFREGNFPKALEYFEKVLDSKEGYSQAWRYKALCLQQMGEYEGAEAAYAQALDSSPEDVLVLSDLATLYHEMEQHEDELKCYERLLEIDPNSYAGWMGRGRTLLTMGMPEEAALCFTKAHRADPSQPDALYHKGLALLETDKNEAEGTFREVIAASPLHVGSLRQLVSLLLDDARTDEALELAKRLVAADREDGENHHVMGNALWEAGRHVEAYASFQKALILEPQSKAIKADLDRLRDVMARIKEERERPETAEVPEEEKVSETDREEFGPEEDIAAAWPPEETMATGDAGEPEMPSPLPHDETEEAVEEQDAPDSFASLLSESMARTEEVGAGKEPEPREEDASAPPLPERTPTLGFEEVLLSEEPVEKEDEEVEPETPGVDDVPPEDEKEGPGAQAGGEVEEAADEDADDDTEEISFEADPSFMERLASVLGSTDDGKDGPPAVEEQPETDVPEIPAAGPEPPGVDREEFVCFGDFDEGDEDCAECEVSDECRREALGPEDEGDYICFGEFDGDEEECTRCPIRERCREATE